MTDIMGEVPVVADLTIYTGQTFRKSYTWKDAAGEPIDLTGWTASLVYGAWSPVSAIDRPGGTLLQGISGGVVLGDASGAVDITIETALTDILTNGSQNSYGGVQVQTAAEWPPYAYHLDFIDPDGKVTVFLHGLLLVQKTLLAA